MNKDSTLIIRINSSLKNEVSEITSKEGTDISKLVNAYLLDTAQRGHIPINIKSKLGLFDKKMPSIDIPLIKKQLQRTIEEKNLKDKITKVYLFGSYARGEQTNNSDIDIRVISTNECSLFDIGNLSEGLKKQLNKDVDVVTAEDDKLDQSFLNNIKKDFICIYDK